MDKTNVNSLIESINLELNSIAEKGLNSNNFDVCYRLVDMLYKLTEVNSMSECKKTVYEAYTQAKRVYRHSHTQQNQEMIIKSLTDYLDDMTDTINSMMLDCDCEDEKRVIQNYISRL